MEVRRQLCRVDSLPPLCGFQGLISGSWALRAAFASRATSPVHFQFPLVGLAATSLVPLSCLPPVAEVVFLSHRPPLSAYNPSSVLQGLRAKSQAISWTSKVLPESALKPDPTTMGTALVLRNKPSEALEAPVFDTFLHHRAAMVPWRDMNPEPSLSSSEHRKHQREAGVQAGLTGRVLY